MESTVRSYSAKPVTQRLGYSGQSSPFLTASNQRTFSTSPARTSQSQLWSQRVPQTMATPAMAATAASGMGQSRMWSPIGYISPAEQNVSIGPDWLSQLLAGYRVEFE